MNTFGVTGSIACGKSTFTNFIRQQGIAIVDADLVARDVVAPTSKGLEQIVSTFGEKFLQPDGWLDRTKLGAHVFSDPMELEKLNKIMHPLIQRESLRQITALHTEGHELVGYDAALLIEMGNADRFRPLIVVTAPFETQLARLMRRNNLSEAAARNRISKQLSSEEKAKHADFVVETTGTLEELEIKAKEIVSSVKEYFKNKG